MTDLARAQWRKSSYSGGNDGQCVELAPHGAIRDSKNPGPTLAMNLPAFIAAVKADAFTA